MVANTRAYFNPEEAEAIPCGSADFPHPHTKAMTSTKLLVMRTEDLLEKGIFPCFSNY